MLAAEHRAVKHLVQIFFVLCKLRYNFRVPVDLVRETDMPRKPKSRLESRIRVRMAETGIRSVSALKRALARYGITISDAQLGRVVDGKVEHVSIRLIEGLLAVLSCGLADLYTSAA